MTNRLRVPAQMAPQIETEIPPYEPRLEETRSQSMPGAARTYADALGRSYFYLGRDEEARRHMAEAFELSQQHLEEYRRKFQVILEKGNPHDAKPTDLAYQVMAFFPSP